MSATTSPDTLPSQNKPPVDPTIFKILDDGTVLYKTYDQAEYASKQLKAAKPAGDSVKKLSHVKYGENYQTKDGQTVPYTLGTLVEFQFTGLIVVMVVLLGLYLICAGIGRLIKALDRSGAASPVKMMPSSPPTPAGGIHPGLTDQQLVVLLTAAASEAVGSTVRVDSIR
jgi:hypothetical protein